MTSFLFIDSVVFDDGGIWVAECVVTWMAREQSVPPQPISQKHLFIFVQNWGRLVQVNSGLIGCGSQRTRHSSAYLHRALSSLWYLCSTDTWSDRCVGRDLCTSGLYK